MSVRLGNGKMGDKGDLHGSRVTEGLAELTSDLVLRGQIDLLEELGGDGQAAGGLDLPQRIIRVVVVVEVVTWTQLVSMTALRRETVPPRWKELPRQRRHAPPRCLRGAKVPWA